MISLLFNLHYYFLAKTTVSIRKLGMPGYAWESNGLVLVGHKMVFKHAKLFQFAYKSYKMREGSKEVANLTERKN